jgi:hypothetical protein
MTLQDIYNEVAYGNGDNRPSWQHDDPKDCGCHGYGWYHSDLDTIHQCPFHYNGQRNPEWDPQEE